MSWHDTGAGVATLRQQMLWRVLCPAIRVVVALEIASAVEVAVSLAGSHDGLGVLMFSSGHSFPVWVTSALQVLSGGRQHCYLPLLCRADAGCLPCGFISFCLCAPVRARYDCWPESFISM